MTLYKIRPDFNPTLRGQIQLGGTILDLSDEEASLIQHMLEVVKPEPEPEPNPPSDPPPGTNPPGDPPPGTKPKK